MSRAERQTKWLDTVLTGCEILAAHGGDKSLLNSLLKTFIDEKNRNVRYLSTSDYESMDLLMRSFALHCALNDLPTTVEDFLVHPKHSTDNEANQQSSNHRRIEELQKFTAPLITVYEARAKLIVGTSGPHEAGTVLTAASYALINDDYYFSRIHSASQMRQHLSVSIANLCFIQGINDAELWAAARGVFGSRMDAIASQDLATIERFALRSTRHADILSLLADRARSISGTRTVAHEKREALLKLVRVAALFSYSDAAALFKEVLTLNEDVDRYAPQELQALCLMANHGVTAMGSPEKRLAAQQLFAIVTDVAICLEDEEACPWWTIMEALTRLDESFALAACARWQDSAIVDLTSSLSPLLRVSLTGKSLSPPQVAALLALLPTTDEHLVKGLSANAVGLSASVRDSITEDIARDELLHQEARGGIDVVKTLEQMLNVNSTSAYWLPSLREAVEFVDLNSDATQSSPTPSSVDSSPQPRTSFTFLSKTTEADLLWELTAALDEGGPRYPIVRARLELIKGSVSVGDRVHYLDLLSGLRSDHVPGDAIADGLRSAIEEWATLPAVRVWCETRLPGFISERLPSLVRYVSYNARELRSLLRFLPSTTNVSKLIAHATGTHASTLHVSTVYALISLIAELSQSEQVASATLVALGTRFDAIPKAVSDVIDIDDVPTKSTESIARMLFALLSDCNVRIRWRAAHAVRRIARYGDAETLEALIRLYNRTDELSYRAAQKPFYWMAARLWSVITLHRIAHELPGSIAAYGPHLIQIATDESFPHVLIRSFAKAAALELIASGRFSPGTQDRDLLESVNRGAVARETKRKDWSEQNSRNQTKSEPRFKFDHIDTVPYWYSPAIGVFHDVSLGEFLEVADRWIIDKWGVDADVSRWSDSRERRFTQHERLNATNDHGSDPTMEGYSIYLECHAMHCAVGELMSSRALQAVEGDGYSGFEEWLARRENAMQPYWLADVLCPIPLEKRFWLDEISGAANWLGAPAEAEYLRELLIDKDKAMIVVDAYHEVRGRERSCDVILSSALVEPST